MAKTSPLGPNSVTISGALSTNLIRLKSLLRRPYLTVHLLEGHYQGAPLRVLVADDSSVLPYIKKPLFAEEPKVSQKGRISCLQAHRLCQDDADLVVIGANQLLLPLYKNRGFLFVPKWVRLYLPLRAHPDDMLASLNSSTRQDLRRNLRKMREQGFEYHVTSDKSWLDEFYDTMYVPYCRARHVDYARVKSRETLKACYGQGVGVVVTQQGRSVAGAVSFLHGKTMWSAYMGVLNGDLALAHDGAVVALYYYSQVHAYNIGCTGIDFGNSRPFLSESSLKYKLKWGMQVLNVDDGIGLYALASPGDTESAKRFLSENPFYHITESGIELHDGHA
jgi:hypothetical protein